MSSSSSNSSYLKREDLLGKSVISRNARVVGTVVDMAVSLDGKVAVQVSRKTPSADSSDLYISSEEIQAVGDVILLKTGSDSVGKAAVAPVPVISNTSPSNTSSTIVAPPPFLGATQGRSCPKCGYLNSQISKFCIKCGTALL
ncbi:MAG: zinc-ribbon domain-containing protein [Thaumarchaeota archaeon]|nr:zinc-ribbon domain-containing protein [Nitrososphaerota archaeon]